MVGEYKRIAEREEKLAQYKGSDEVISSVELMNFLEEERKKTKQIKFPSGYSGLDKLIDGFEGGELIVISGYTKHGKTLFCMCLTENFYKKDVKSLWFSYEVLPYQFLKKCPGNCIFYLPRTLQSRALNWIEDRIIESKLKYDTRAVFIDHLHYLVDMERLQNPSIEIGSIVRRLKTFAIAHNLVIFLIAHISKINIMEEPTEAHLRDSGMIACEADSTIMVRRRYIKESNEFTNETKITVRNHRRTGVMAKSVKLYFNKNMLWEEMPPTDPVELYKKAEAIDYDDLPF